MRSSIPRRAAARLAALLALLLGAATPAVAAQPYRAPRTADGHPDLQGYWTVMSMTTMEREPNLPLTFATPAEEAAYEAKTLEAWHKWQARGVGQGLSEWQPQSPLARIDGKVRTSWIVTPADGQLPWRPEARARFEALDNAVVGGSAAGPEARTPSDRCLVGGLGSAGPPFVNPLVAGGKQIVQAGDQVAILSEMNHDVRIVRVGAAHGPAALHPWMGDSIGHWEGQTLVVETTGFHPQEAFRGLFLISPGARVTERFTRVSAHELRYAFAVDDPVNYTQVWSGEMPLLPDKGPLFEFACHEGNYAMAGILAGARKAEADAAAAKTGAAKTGAP